MSARIHITSAQILTKHAIAIAQLDRIDLKHIEIRGRLLIHPVPTQTERTTTARQRQAGISEATLNSRLAHA